MKKLFISLLIIVAVIVASSCNKEELTYRSDMLKDMVQVFQLNNVEIKIFGSEITIPGELNYEYISNINDDTLVYEEETQKLLVLSLYDSQEVNPAMITAIKKAISDNELFFVAILGLRDYSYYVNNDIAPINSNDNSLVVTAFKDNIVDNSSGIVAPDFDSICETNVCGYMMDIYIYVLGKIA